MTENTTILISWIEDDLDGWGVDPKLWELLSRVSPSDYILLRKKEINILYETESYNGRSMKFPEWAEKSWWSNDCEKPWSRDSIRRWSRLYLKMKNLQNK